ncbi:hypothetical protein [Streptomyces zaomyceticus]|uniref:hypothetical protein n=1 Tax=Streptomyces zaomyceticus TaxID=68286 RepID=UPI0036AD04C5
MVPLRKQRDRRWAGQASQVLFQYYADFPDGLQEHSNRLTEEAVDAGGAEPAQRRQQPQRLSRA